MSQISRQVINPAALPPAALDAFAVELYAMHCRVFEGVTAASFRAYVLESDAWRTRIQVLRDAGRVVGYTAIHFYARTVEGEPLTVMRVETGLERAYRGGTVAGPFLAREIIAAMVLRPTRRMVTLSALVHPSSYAMYDRYAPTLWPRPGQSASAKVRRLVDQLAGSFGLRPVDHADPGVVHVGWVTRQSERSARSWRQHRREAARWFVRRNPGYRRGHGLVTVAPVDPTTVVRGLCRLLLKKLRRAVRGPVPMIDHTMADTTMA